MYLVGKNPRLNLNLQGKLGRGLASWITAWISITLCSPPFWSFRGVPPGKQAKVLKGHRF